MTRLFSAAKAIYGAAMAGLTASYAVLQAAGHIDWTSGVFIAISVVGSFAVIFGVPNTAVSPPRRGARK